eukprot:TRINITY_DN7266_c0_g1_i1.p1 TRINITY_DN7266_c0_g1~~TRINITY_DN7266_c0_g1_i1.p1  ORF type:complete len:368 (+),score=41.53 TRINITY_DN7266_c0_g1_i1:246-1349(+)
MPNEIESDADVTPELSTDTSERTFSAEYNEIVETSSYRHFRSKIQQMIDFPYEGQCAASSSDDSQRCSRELVAELLSPDEEYINAILEQRILIKNPELANLVSNYFSNGENASIFCIHLLHCLRKAGSSCTRLNGIMESIRDVYDLTLEQYSALFMEFCSFMKGENPFPQSVLEKFQTINESFGCSLGQLKQHHHQVCKKLGCLHRFRIGSALCLVGICVGVVIVAIVIAMHALVAIAGLFSLPIVFFRKFQFKSVKSLRRHCSQVDAAMRGTYILSKDIDTLSRLVRRLHNDFEHSRTLIQFCLQRRGEKHPVQEVVKELQKHGTNFTKSIEDVKNHVCVCLMTINRVRKLLVKEIRAITKDPTSP